MPEDIIHTKTNLIRINIINTHTTLTNTHIILTSTHITHMNIRITIIMNTQYIPNTRNTVTTPITRITRIIILPPLLPTEIEIL